jgi:hypothetical protein
LRLISISCQYIHAVAVPMRLMLPAMPGLLLLLMEQGAWLLQLLQQLLPVAARLHICLQLC